MSEAVTPFDPTVARDRLTSRLDEFRRRVRVHVTVAGLARVVATAAGLALLSFVIDRVFRLGVGVRAVLLIAGFAALAYETWRLILWPLTRQVSFVDLADAMDRIRPAAPLAPRIASVLELTRLLDHPSGPSPAMVRAAVQHASDSLENVDLADRLDRHRLKQNGGAIAGVIGLVLLLAILFPETAGLWAKRWFAFSKQPWPQRTYLHIAGLTADGRLLVPRGESAVVRVGLREGSEEPEAIALRARPADRGGKRVEANMTRFAAGDFRHELPPVQAALFVDIEGGDDAIGPITVEPVDRPRVERMQLTTQHPTDSKQTTHDLGSAEGGDASFLPHTVMQLRIRSTAPISQASLGEGVEGVALTRENDREYSAKWTHARAMNFKIELTGAATGLTSIVTPLTIGLKADKPPQVSLASSGVRQRITPQATIPLTITARDDYGVHDVQLSAKLEFLDAEQKRQTTESASQLFGPQKPAVETEVPLKHRVSVAAMKPPVGALISLVTIATDDHYGAPQTSKSREAAFRVVAPEELFREILLRQQGERAKFRKAREEAEKIRADLSAASKPEQVAALARRHRAVQREAARVGTSLAESLTEMQLNVLGSVEAYELMHKNVLAPIKTLDEGVMTQQRDALDALSAPGAPNVDSAVARQDEVIAQMNAILKQMAQWDSFIDVLNQLNEIIRLQENAKQTTEQLKTKQAESIFDK